MYTYVCIGSSDDKEEKYDAETQEMARLMGVTPEELSATMSKTAKAQLPKSPIYIHLNTKYTRAQTLKDASACACSISLHLPSLSISPISLHLSPSPISTGCSTRRTGGSNTQEAGEATQGSGGDSGSDSGPWSGQCLWCRSRRRIGAGNRNGQESRPQEEKCWR